MRERLYRSRDDRVLFGVCGGIADWLDLDPSLVRIVFALFVLAGGIGFLLYIVMAIVVPEEPAYYPTAATAPPVGGVSDASGGTAQATTDATPSAPGVAPMAGGPSPATGAPMYPPNSWAADRAARRDARRAARAAMRGHRDNRGAMIFGAILVLLGAWFLIQRYVPALNGDYLGPLVLIAIGVVVIGSAMNRPGPDDPSRPPR